MVLISLRSKCLEDERKNKKIYEEKWTILQLFLLFFKDDSERQKWSKYGMMCSSTDHLPKLNQTMVKGIRILLDIQDTKISTLAGEIGLIF